MARASTPFGIASTDAAGNVEREKSVRVKIDTVGPAIAAKNLTARRGREVELDFFISDKLSPKAKNVRITVVDAAGKTVKSFSLSTEDTNEWESVDWKPSAKGVYRYTVTAQDLAGNAQRKAGVGKVTVK